jgi:hypothetical protein
MPGQDQSFRELLDFVARVDHQLRKCSAWTSATLHFSEISDIG